MADNTFVNIGGHKVSAGIKYSTTEVKTGNVWIDGKPIYRKVVELNRGNAYGWSASLGISNMNDITYFLCYARQGGTIRVLPFCYGAGDGSPAYTWFGGVTIRKAGSVDFELGSAFYNSTNTTKGFVVIIEYTKTTD